MAKIKVLGRECLVKKERLEEYVNDYLALNVPAFVMNNKLSVINYCDGWIYNKRFTQEEVDNMLHSLMYSDSKTRLEIIKKLELTNMLILYVETEALENN